MSAPLPVTFFGHGSPMNALQRNAYTEAWSRIGERLPAARAVLVISAHWLVPRTAVTSAAAPRTIHDFGGFPRELYQVQYPAPGDPQLAREVGELLHPVPVALDDSWGLDHGTWSVLRHVYPRADVPVLQLSMDETQPAGFHFDLGRRLRHLRRRGVWIVGSGNLVHNLRAYAWGRDTPQPYDWAVRFEKQARELILTGRWPQLVQYESLGADALLSVPTPEHFLPLLYVLGAAEPGETISFPVEGIEGGSISMLAVQVGGAPAREARPEASGRTDAQRNAAVTPANTLKPGAGSK
ncbi:MAG TPA: 4,5-DOPA dioxygenase extradiol [Steroidobacteraceae bacterium]|nr:4,5-DOPA dioxygenase extradiol [Steroidobacteraceae bacterium]